MSSVMSSSSLLRKSHIAAEKKGIAKKQTRIGAKTNITIAMRSRTKT
jgi:hypothetical protein